MQKTRLQSAVGARMREAAKAAGLSVEELARRQDVRPGSIYRWWAGDRRPSEAELDRYAVIVGVSARYLETGQPDDQVFSMGSSAPADDVLELMRLLLDRIAVGETASAAYDAVIGRPEELSPGERRSFDRRSPGLRELILREAGRPWQELSEADRRHLVERLIAQEDARAAHTGPQDADEP